MSENEILPHLKLRMNIQHPDFEDCYLDGYDSALNDMTEEANPFPIGSNEHQYWVDGWWDGFYGEEALFSKEKLEDKEGFKEEAANDTYFQSITSLFNETLVSNILKITGIIAATAVMGYQVIDLVA